MRGRVHKVGDCVTLDSRVDLEGIFDELGFVNNHSDAWVVGALLEQFGVGGEPDMVGGGPSGLSQSRQSVVAGVVEPEIESDFELTTAELCEVIRFSES